MLMNMVWHLAKEVEEFDEGKTVMVVITGGVNTIVPLILPDNLGCQTGWDLVSAWRKIMLMLINKVLEVTLGKVKKSLCLSPSSH